MERNCDNCNKKYTADPRNLKRGWGLCCSKSCAAQKREKTKPNYNPERVKRNNIRRVLWNGNGIDENHYGIYRGERTTEGYKIYGNTAVDEHGEAVYTVDPYNDDHPFSENAFN